MTPSKPYEPPKPKEPEEEGGHGTFVIIEQGEWVETFYEAEQKGKNYLQNNPGFEIRIEAT